MPEDLMRPRNAAPFPNDWTEDRGDRLFREGHVTEVPRPRLGIVLGLLLLCLIPRLWAGTLHDIICPDAVSYIRWSEALGNGDLVEAFGYTGLNIYPPLLLGLKHLPGDWLVTAKWWSVAMAALAILPIYGWLRRQFNETLALLGCGFYALHPAMIHDSPLIVRDPTFWLLFALGLYFAWRAVSELRYRWFVAFAVIFGLSIHLRTEGWLTAPVFLAWAAFRMRYAASKRALLALAALAALAVGPVCGICIRAVVLAQADGHVAGHLRHLDYVNGLTDATSGSQIAAIAEGTLEILVRYVKAFGYLQLALATAGLVHWRARIFGPSKGPLLLYCVLSLGAIWACFCLAGMDRRYVFPSVIASLPTIAAGMCLGAARCVEIANRSRKLPQTGFSAWLLGLMLGGCIFLSVTIITKPRPLQYDQAEIGRWIRANVGPNQTVAVNLEWTRLVEYYGECHVSCRTLPTGPGDPNRVWFAQTEMLPGVILIWLDWRNPAGRTPFEDGIRRAKELGYREVPAGELPRICRQIVVVVRRPNDTTGQGLLPSGGSFQNDHESHSLELHVVAKIPTDFTRAPLLEATEAVVERIRERRSHCV